MTLNVRRLNLSDLHIDDSWCLYLDRDGVINKRLPGDYVKSLEEWEWLSGVPEAIAELSGLFKYVFVVTNQQGIGKGIMTHDDLAKVHNHLSDRVDELGGRISAIYYAPELDSPNKVDRKPAIGMALKSRQHFPDVDFSKSIMVGDSGSDMEFGKTAGMKTVFISDKDNDNADYRCGSLMEFTEAVRQAFRNSK